MLVRDSDDKPPSEVVRYGGIPFVKTDDGWAMVDSPDLRGVVELD